MQHPIRPDRISSLHAAHQPGARCRTRNPARLAALLLLAAAPLAAQVPPPNGPGGALAFDGVNDHLTAAPPGIPAGNSPYTIEAWIKTSAMNAGTIAAWGNFGVNNQVTAFRLTPTGLVNYWWGAGNDLYATLPSLVGAWHHVAATFDGTNRRILLDGVVQASDVPAAHNAGAGNFFIGSRNGVEFFSGQMDEIRIWSVARTPAQIQEAMRRQLWGNEPGLVACWRFDERIGLTAADATGTAANVATLVNGPAWVASTLTPFAPDVTLLAAGQDPNFARQVRFSGLFNPRGSASAVWFEWGASPSLENRAGLFAIGDGTEAFEFSYLMPALTPGMTYHVRAVGTNLHGRSCSPTATFVMGPLPTNVVLHLGDSGYGSLREVIRDLLPGETVRFAPGLTGTLAIMNGEIIMAKPLRIEGPGADRLTLDGGQRSRLFRIRNTVVKISGLTLVNGRVAGASGANGASSAHGGEGESVCGGVILNEADLTLSNCVIASSSALGGRGGAGGPDTTTSGPGDGGLGGTGAGGAICNLGTLTLINTTFHGHRAEGGAGGNGGTGFNHPDAAGGAGRVAGLGYGGAVYNQGILRATHCAFFDNFALGGIGGRGGQSRLLGGAGGPGGEGRGGALYSLGPFTLINCTFAGGSANGGNGGDTGVGFNGSRFGGRGGLGSGGALANFGEGTVVHCTVAFNAAIGGNGGTAVSLPGQNGGRGEAQGGGVSSAWQSGASLVALNTVIAHNTTSGSPEQGRDAYAGVTSLGHNFIRVNDVPAAGWVASDILGTPAAPRDPQIQGLTQLARSIWALPPLRGSPLIDAGDDIVLGDPLHLTSDQRGGPRRILGHVDIGAAEAGAGVRLTRLQRSGTAYDVSFTTEWGFPHRLESRDALTPGPWTTVGPIAISGTGGEVTVQDTRPGSPTNRFYRAVMMP